MINKELRRKLRHRATVGLPGVFRYLPEPMGRGLCARLGTAGYVLVARDRRYARINFSRVNPDWDGGRIRRETRRVFEEIGRNAYDFLRYPHLSPTERDRLVRLEGAEHLQRRCGRGAVLVSAHLGSWELIGATLAHRGYPLLALTRPLKEARLDRALERHRDRMGVATLSSSSLPLPALRHLKEGGFLGLLADQRVKKGGVEVDFLGQATMIPEGPARLAIASRAPILPLAIVREADHRHCLRVLPPLWPRATTDPVRDLSQRTANALSSLIERAPEQWMWIHPRWKSLEEPAPHAAATFRREPATTATRGEDACVVS